MMREWGLKRKWEWKQAGVPCAPCCVPAGGDFRDSARVREREAHTRSVRLMTSCQDCPRRSTHAVGGYGDEGTCGLRTLMGTAR